MSGRRAKGQAKSVRAPKPDAEISIRRCHGLAEFAACVEIERPVWGSADADLVPLAFFVVAAETGGQVLGAFDGDRMIGFTLAIAGVRGGKPFLHSHMTAVLEPYRNRGIGRRLKLFQREDALERGIELIEWTFDPLEVKNAHFNFRLGAIVRRFLPNLYGITSSQLHSRLPTDRLVAEWWLDSARVRRSVSGGRRGKKTKASRRKKLARIRVPAEMDTLRRVQSEEALHVQANIRQEFEHWLGRGYAATAIEVGPGGGEYILEPWRKQ